MYVRTTVTHGNTHKVAPIDNTPGVFATLQSSVLPRILK